MRTILLSFFLFCGYTPSVFSLSNTGMIDFFYIKEQACHRSGSCFNLLDNGQKTAEAQYSDQTSLVVTNKQLKHQRFREQFDESSLTAEEEIKQFIYLGCDLVASHSLSPSEEQAILQVLANRLMNL